MSGAALIGYAYVNSDDPAKYELSQAPLDRSARCQLPGDKQGGVDTVRQEGAMHVCLYNEATSELLALTPLSRLLKLNALNMVVEDCRRPVKAVENGHNADMVITPPVPGTSLCQLYTSS